MYLPGATRVISSMAVWSYVCLLFLVVSYLYCFYLDSLLVFVCVLLYIARASSPPCVCVLFVLCCSCYLLLCVDYLCLHHLLHVGPAVPGAGDVHAVGVPRPERAFIIMFTSVITVVTITDTIIIVFITMSSSSSITINIINMIIRISLCVPLSRRRRRSRLRFASCLSETTCTIT